MGDSMTVMFCLHVFMGLLCNLLYSFYCILTGFISLNLGVRLIVPTLEAPYTSDKFPTVG